MLRKGKKKGRTLLPPHLACPVNPSTASSLATSTVETLSHLPFGRWVEEGDVFAFLESIGSGGDLHDIGVEDLWLLLVFVLFVDYCKLCNRGASILGRNEKNCFHNSNSQFHTFRPLFSSSSPELGE